MASPRWSYGSNGIREMQTLKQREIDSFLEKILPVMRQLPVFVRLSGEECFHVLRDITVTPELKRDLEKSLADMDRLFGMSNVLIGSFDCADHGSGLLVLVFENDAPDARLASAQEQNFWMGHLKASFQLRAQREERNGRLAAPAAVMESLVWGVTVTNSDGEILLSNKVADQVMEDWPQIWVRSGKLVVPDVLSEKLSNVPDCDDAEQEERFVVHLFDNLETGNALLVLAQKIGCQTEQFTSEDVEVIYFFLDANNHETWDVNLASRLFQLTEAETECMALFLTGSTRQEVASQRDVSLETIRSQAASIIRKTGARNMSGAIAKFMNLNLPVKINGGDNTLKTSALAE